MTFGIRLRLIAYWQLVWKKWSFIFNSIGTVIFAYLALAPDAIINIWGGLPDSAKDLLPQKFALWVPLVLYVLGLISQFIKQQKLENEKAKLDQNGTL